MTKFALAASLFSSATSPITITYHAHTGKVVCMEMEDGSGKCWNVIIIDSDSGHKMPMFIRTVD